MEAQEKEAVKQDTYEADVINAIKNRVRLIPVTLDGGKAINLPVRYSLNVSEAYHNSFEKTNDCRAAFCDMVYQMVEDNIKFVDDKEEIKDLTVEDIKTLSDEDLKKIGETLIQEVDTLKKHYYKNNEIDFFERFHNAICGERKEFEEKLKASMRPVVETIKLINKSIRMTPSMQSLLNTISAAKQVTSTLGDLQPSFKDTQYSNDWLKNIDFKSPIVTTNDLLQEVSERIQKLNERETKSIEINEKIADVLLELYQAQEKSEKMNRITQMFAILASIASILGLFGIDRIYKWLMYILSWLRH